MEKTLIEQIQDTLTGHQIDWWDDSRALNEYVCTCRKVTNDHAAHQATVLAPLITAAQAEAWDKGRASANVMLPMHPPKMPSNPYAKETE